MSEPKREPIHFYGTGAVACKRRPSDETRHVTMNPLQVTCKDCNRILFKKEGRMTNRALTILILAALLFFIFNMILS
jgi:hypothetical protein